ERKPIDIISVIDGIRNKGLLEAVGDIHYITSLSTIVPSPSNIDYYIDILIDKSNRRTAITVLNSIDDKIFNGKIEELRSDIESLRSIFKNNCNVDSLYVDASDIKRSKNYK